MKILLSGVSGIGKTTLAKAISEKYNIPFIVGSSKVLWPKFNISSHQELIAKCDENVRFALDFQYRLLEYRRDEMAKHESFVSDRGVMDNLVYYLLQISHKVNQAETVNYIEACKEIITPDILQLYLIFDEYVLKKMGEIESDGARITNSYYQLMVASVFDMVIGKSLINERTACMNTWDFGKRLMQVEQLVIDKYGKQGFIPSLF